MAKPDPSPEAAVAAARARHEGAAVRDVLARRGLGGYAGYAGWLSRIHALAGRGATLELLGRSVRGEPVLGLVLGDPDARRCSALIAGLHPIEWIGVETCLTLAERLLDVRGRRVIIAPLCNPDGILAVQGHVLAGRRRFVRHNARRVDLNRNFPAFWGGRGLQTWLPTRLFAPGRAPASEPEVRALVTRFRREQVDRAVSLHSFGGVVLYPYGAKWKAPLDAPELRRWAARVAASVDARRPYRAVQSARWVPGFTAPGMELDWFHDDRGALSLLVECSRGNALERPLRLSRLLDPFAWFNPSDPERVASAIAAALEPFLRGESGD